MNTLLNIPDVKSKKRKASYRKPESVKQLEALAMDEARSKYSCPHLAPRTFRDDSANGLTKCIVSYIQLKGGFASRINSTGQYRPELRKYVYGTGRRGLADIMATFKGKSLHIEVKIGRDRQSEHQMKVQAEVEKSGGLYYKAKDFTMFKQWLDKI